MDFDFDGYLNWLDPDVSYQVKPVSGGNVNVVIRATRTDKDVENGRFPGRESLILKYAPPYIAAVGESAPMSPFRQTIEARALGLFLESRPDSLHHVLEASGIQVPELLNHDAESNVVVISDLGRLPNLSDIFSGLGGYTPGNHQISVSQFPSLDQDLNAKEFDFFADVGSRLGAFFRRLHARRTIEVIRLDSPSEYFENLSTREAILEHAIKPIEKHLRQFPRLITDAEAKSLGTATVDDFLRENSDEELALTLGDCWTGAVLVDTTSQDLKPRIGMIDWEFASIGRGINGDMSQFMAHLELFRIAADQDSKFIGHQRALQAIIDELTKTYSQDYEGQNTTNTIRPNSLNDSRRMRSAFLSHGAEIINCALWKVWICTESNCPARTGNTPAPHECRLVQNMVERGIWFLRHAAKDPETFSADENWSKSEVEARRMRDAGKRWLLDLFSKPG